MPISTLEGLLFLEVSSEDRQCCSVHTEVQMALLFTEVTESCGYIGITLSTEHMDYLLPILLMFIWATNR